MAGNLKFFCLHLYYLLASMNSFGSKNLLKYRLRNEVSQANFNTLVLQKNFYCHLWKRFIQSSQVRPSGQTRKAGLSTQSSQDQLWLQSSSLKASQVRYSCRVYMYKCTCECSQEFYIRVAMVGNHFILHKYKVVPPLKRQNLFFYNVHVHCCKCKQNACDIIGLTVK